MSVLRHFDIMLSLCYYAGGNQSSSNQAIALGQCSLSVKYFTRESLKTFEVNTAYGIQSNEPILTLKPVKGS